MNEEPQTGELSAEELKEVERRAVRDDRIEMFTHMKPLLDAVSTAVEALPYRDAMVAFRNLKEASDLLLDKVGEYTGDCHFCDEPMFLTGEADEDFENGDEVAYHRTCGDRMRGEHPEMFGPAEESDEP